MPLTHTGSLLKEEEVLRWLIHQVSSDEIEDVTDQMLDKLIDKAEHIAVLFCEKFSLEFKGIELMGVRGITCLEQIYSPIDTIYLYF